VWWVEGNPAVEPKIKEVLKPYPNQHLIPVLLSDRNDEPMTLHVTNYDGMSSSVLRFGTHTEFSPDTVYVRDVVRISRTIDSLIASYRITDVNMLVMDLQGFEGPVLRGGLGLIPHLDYVMSEVNCKEVYIGATMVSELDQLLSDFDRVETTWVSNFGWGDGFYARRPQ